MAKKRTTCEYPEPRDVPRNLDETSFYELRLDDDQKVFRDAIWNPKNLSVFCNSKAGAGKTLVAVATAVALVECRLYDEIVYIMAPYAEKRQGFLPGTISEKSQHYFTPLYQALLKIGRDPQQYVKQDATMLNQKNGTAYVTCITDTYVRGSTLSRAIVIIDEAQNFTVEQLKTVITRISDDSKVIVIGHDKQCDLTGAKSGFLHALRHFSDREWNQVCSLTINHRGVLSSWADEM